MRITKILLIGLWMLFAGIVSVSSVKAIGCVVYRCYEDPICEPDGYGGQICSLGEAIWCNGDCGGIDNGGCPPNFHITPSGQCLPNGTGDGCECGVKADGTCKNCNQMQCQEPRLGIDCPPGTVKTENVVWTQCFAMKTYCAVGTAQTQGACCEQTWDDCATEWWWYGGGEWVCAGGYVCTKNWYTTYSCAYPCTATAPSNIVITEGASPTAINVNWTAGTGGTGQIIMVDESEAEVNAGCPTPNACEVNGYLTPFTAGSNNMYPVTGLEPDTTYYVRIETYQNTTCRPGVTVSTTTPEDNRIRGVVYLDESNSCTPTAPGWSLGGLSVSVRDTAYSTSVAGNGSYTIVAGPEGSYSHLDLSGIPEGYACATGPGCPLCPTLGGVLNPSSSNNFFLTTSREAWWQVEGAGIYAGGTGGIRSILPDSSMRLILDGLGGSEGALITASGSTSIGLGEISDPGWVARSRYRGRLMDYNFFSAHMGVVRGRDSDWISDTLDLPVYDGRNFWYMDPPSGLASIEAGSPWNIGVGESYVIFVNDSLEINSNITVSPGGFLAFIVKGDVIVDPSVTSIAGLFVINNTFTTETANVGEVINDVQLETQGSVVAWSSFDLGRDLGGDTNPSIPAEKFVYRPDLLSNMPERMKTFVYRWQEVVPGTYGE